MSSHSVSANLTDPEWFLAINLHHPILPLEKQPASKLIFIKFSGGGDHSPGVSTTKSYPHYPYLLSHNDIIPNLILYANAIHHHSCVFYFVFF